MPYLCFILRLEIGHCVGVTLFQCVQATDFLTKIFSLPEVKAASTFRNEDGAIRHVDDSDSFDTLVKSFTGLTSSALEKLRCHLIITAYAVMLKRVGEKVGTVWVASDGRGAPTNPKSYITVSVVDNGSILQSQDEPDNNQAFAEFFGGYVRTQYSHLHTYTCISLCLITFVCVCVTSLSLIELQQDCHAAQWTRTEHWNCPCSPRQTFKWRRAALLDPHF